MLTRRTFLGNCSLVAAAACLHPAVVMADNSATPGTRATLPGYADFFPQINTPFNVRSASHPAPLVLVAVTPLTTARTDPAVAGNEAFCLRFRGPGETRLTQDTYHLMHPRLGALEIFLVPAGWPDPADGYYEAIFDRPVSPEILARQIALAPRRERIT